MAGHCPYAHLLAMPGAVISWTHMPTTPRGPGPVAAVHRIFIVTALLCALAYAAWELNEMARTGEALAGLRGALGLLVAAGPGVYLRRLRGLGAALAAARRGARAHARPLADGARGLADADDGRGAGLPPGRRRDGGPGAPALRAVRAGGARGGGGRPGCARGEAPRSRLLHGHGA